MESPQHFTLKQVADSIRKVIAERYARTYWVTAEMHKLNQTRKGHCYPELVQKEDDEIVVEMRGTIWKQQFDRIQQKFHETVKEPLRDGMELLFLVKINYHPLYNIGLEILDIDPNYTLGSLQKERQQTLERLNKEGILNTNQQLEMAIFPKRLAIISQVDSKGYSDFVTLLNGHPKHYHFNTFLFEATLQGDSAITSIQSQLKRIEKVKHHFDAVVIIRGGGGEIGMHCYNNYDLAKSIATFPLPVLTGIGHSTNLTVCEMIAFRNGITPSDIAYFLLRIAEELDAPLDEYLLKLPVLSTQFFKNTNNTFERIIRLFTQDVKLTLQHESNQFGQQISQFDYALRQFSLTQKSLINEQKQQLLSVFQLQKERQIYQQQRLIQQLANQTKEMLQAQHVQILYETSNLERAATQSLTEKNKQIFLIETHLNLIDPMQVLKRGFAIVSNKHGVLSKKNQVKSGEEIQITTEAQVVKAKVG